MKNYSLLLLLWQIPFGIFAQSNSSDCSNAIYLCTKDLVAIQSLPSAGVSNSEFSSEICFPSKPFVETNSIWFKWKINQPGLLSFTIIPQNEYDDFDFILFKSTDNSLQCDKLESVRCMRTGITLGEGSQSASNCTGATGLSNIGNAISQTIGCSSDVSNFLSPVETKSGEVYALLINNFRSSGGFSLGFGDEVSFTPDIVNCPELVSSSNEIISPYFSISSIYPNPASDKVFMDISSSMNCDASVQIISSNGILLENKIIAIPNGASSHGIPVSSLVSGIYFIKIKSDNFTGITRFYKQ